MQQILSYPFCIPIPLNVGGAVLQVSRARAAIKSGPPPIPQLESKDVWCRADFQNDAVGSRTVDSAGCDEEVVMLASRPLIYTIQRLKRCAILLRVMQLSDQSLSIDVSLQSKVHACVWSGVEQVIAFILRVGHPKIVDDVLLERMHLQRQIATLHGIEEIEANWKLSTEPGICGIAQQVTGTVKHRIHGRNLDIHAVHIEEEMFSSGTQSKHHA